MSSRPTYKLYTSANIIDLRRLSGDILESIRTVANMGGVLEWDYLGERRQVQNGILCDILESYDYWKAAPEKFQVSKPDAVGIIHWGDTQAIRREPSREL